MESFEVNNDTIYPKRSDKAVVTPLREIKCQMLVMYIQYLEI